MKHCLLTIMLMALLSPAFAQDPQTWLSNLPQAKDYVQKRSSSYDSTGANADALLIDTRWTVLKPVTMPSTSTSTIARTRNLYLRTNSTSMRNTARPVRTTVGRLIGHRTAIPASITSRTSTAKATTFGWKLQAAATTSV